MRLHRPGTMHCHRPYIVLWYPVADGRHDVMQGMAPASEGTVPAASAAMRTGDDAVRGLIPQTRTGDRHQRIHGSGS
jgi:hypothetical protein